MYCLMSQVIWRAHVEGALSHPRRLGTRTAESHVRTRQRQGQPDLPGNL